MPLLPIPPAPARAHWRANGICVLAAIASCLGAAAATTPAGPAGAGALPSFLRPGARVSYEAGNSTIAGTHWVRDDERGVVRMADGHLYRPEDSHQSGGVGILQLNLLAVEPGFVAADAATFLNVDLANGIVVSSGATELLGTTDALGDYWINPARLASMAAGRDADGTEVVRGNYELNGRTFKVATIRRSGQAGFSANSYDVETGLLVAGSTVDRDPSQRIVNQSGNDLANIPGNTNISHARFLGIRQTNIPWSGTAPPPGLTPGRRLDYPGNERTVIPQMAGLPQLPPMPGRAVAIAVAVDHVGHGCVSATLSMRADLGPGMPPSEASARRCFSAAMFNGLWIGPGALRALQPNQMLDQDPFTRFRILFGGGQGNMALIVEQGPQEMTERWYDIESGVLMAFRVTRQQQNIGQVVTEYQLAR